MTTATLHSSGQFKELLEPNLTPNVNPFPSSLRVRVGSSRHILESFDWAP
jgi:hypothetical protein